MTEPVSLIFRLSDEEMRDPVLAADKLNQIFGHIIDRLDQIQGFRGDSINLGQLIIQDSGGNEVSGFKNDR